MVDGQQVEGTFRAHQVPLAETRSDDEHRGLLEDWLRSYRPEELFDADGRLRPELRATRAARRPADERQPARQRRAAAARPRRCPTSAAYAAKVSTPGGSVHEPTRVLGELVRDVIAANPTTFRLMGPDETASNRLGAVFEVTDRDLARRDRCRATTTSRPTAG